MTLAQTRLTLGDFLARPEIDDSPAWEFLNGVPTQKPMPKLPHSRLQLRLAQAIESLAQPLGAIYAFPELRCTFSNRSLVPDIAILRREKIPLTPEGEMENTAINQAPDWVIEILSPQQSAVKMLNKITLCLEQGCALGWLINPEEKSIVVYFPDRPPQIFSAVDGEIGRGDDPLPVLPGLDLTLTATQIFSWLKIDL